MTPKPHKVVVLGGGTGTATIIAALKNLNVDISAIITVADSGGSTGRLRDEFGFLPVGDLRQALAALASDSDQSWIRDLLLYRFSKGSGLEGHNLGNLILTALQDMTGSTAKAIEIAEKVFRVHGRIYPATTTTIQLVIEYEDGTVEIGEHNLDEMHGGDRIVNLKTSPRASIYPKAAEAIQTAESIIIGPGDMYGSLLPIIVINGTTQALAATKGKLIYMENLMTHYTQTHNMTATDHLNILCQYMKRSVDAVVVNSAKITPQIKASYAKQHEYPVIDDLPKKASYQIIRAPLIKTKAVRPQKGDTVKRSYIRHDPQKVAILLKKLIG